MKLLFHFYNARLILNVVCFVTFFLILICRAEADDFLRVTKNSEGIPIALESPITEFKGLFKGKLVSVDLVAAVHIADAAYYKALNERFIAYDAVLYELVAPKDHNVELRKRDKDNASMIYKAQLRLKDMLALSSQLEEVDYGAKNFVHADLTPDEFIKAFRARKENIQAVFARVFAASLKESDDPKNQSRDAELLFTLLFDNQPLIKSVRLKRLFASYFESGGSLLDAINGEEGSTLVQGRNDKALHVLRAELEKGRKKVAIFYGGGHMPDLSIKLEKEFGFKKGKTEWLEAWSLRMP